MTAVQAGNGLQLGRRSICATSHLPTPRWGLRSACGERFWLPRMAAVRGGRKIRERRSISRTSGSIPLPMQLLPAPMRRLRYGGQRMQTELRPVARKERIELFDVLRGFALLGILVVNFLGPIGTTMPAVDGLVSDLLGVVFDSSIYPLYSFLFGLGFAVQLQRAQRTGRATAHLYLRRMLALFI